MPAAGGGLHAPLSGEPSRDRDQRDRHLAGPSRRHGLVAMSPNALAHERDESAARYRELVEGSVDAIFCARRPAGGLRERGGPATVRRTGERSARPATSKICSPPSIAADAERRRRSVRARGDSIPPVVVTTSPDLWRAPRIEIRAIRTTFDGRPAIQVGRDVTGERSRAGASTCCRRWQACSEHRSRLYVDERAAASFTWSPAFETQFGLSREQAMADRSMWEALVHPAADRACPTMPAGRAPTSTSTASCA